MSDHILWFNQLGMNDVSLVGGKNASLGEMISALYSKGVNVPDGFATSSLAFTSFLEANQLDNKIQDILSNLNVSDVNALADTGKTIRQWINDASFSSRFVLEVEDAYRQLQAGNKGLSVAVRSSATAEDLPDASFAGQQETFLNIKGLDNVLEAIKQVYASLFNDRAIAYRVHQGFDHHDVAISAGVQRMVRSETACSGVMFTLDTESGFDGVIFITAAYGLGETVVQGAVNPDEFYVSKTALQKNKSAILRRNLGSKAIKMIYDEQGSTDHSVTTVDVSEAHRLSFCLTDEEINELAKQALIIEQHYQCPMDIEWAKDGDDGCIYIVQARPETVKSRQGHSTIERYLLQEKGKILVEGRSVGQRIGAGQVRIIDNINEMDQVQDGDVLVTDMTDPDWEPVMKKAAAIVTNRGGRTCHAAIIARELGIPAVVGCIDATDKLSDREWVTVSCAEGDNGIIYQGKLDFSIKRNDIASMPPIPFKIMLNVGNPDRAFAFQSLPNDGVGLARLEFIINRMIGIHPKALLNYEELDKDLQRNISRRIAGYSSPIDFYVEKLSEGIATIAAAFHPKRVIVRMSDFKSNEYAHLVGGTLYEPDEENPMIGFRGASRYIKPSFLDCFALECRAIKKVREEMGFENVEVMIPFVRTPGEAKQVSDLLSLHQLNRGEHGLKLIMMCELPANALIAEQFLKYFDGYSIGSNDLTQLTLGLDRDSALVAHLFDERNDAVKALLSKAIQSCKKMDRYVGICGQGPSDHPDFARWLMEQGIDSVSLNPDSVLDTWMFLADS